MPKYLIEMDADLMTTFKNSGMFKLLQSLEESLKKEIPYPNYDLEDERQSDEMKILLKKAYYSGIRAAKAGKPHNLSFKLFKKPAPIVNGAALDGYRIFDLQQRWREGFDVGSS